MVGTSMSTERILNSEFAGWGSLNMLKIKPLQKNLFPETIETHFMYYVSACPSSHEFSTQQSKVKLDHVGPHTLQPKQGEHTIFLDDNM
jgi:hypothetical protein